jgi:prophage regulatory protein
MENNNRILRLKDVQGLTGLSRSTIYEHMKVKNFPQPVKLGSHSVGWIESEVQGWISHLMEARNVGTAPF